MSAAIILLTLAFAQPDPAVLLDRARLKIAANASAISRYTCTQTIDRELRRIPEKAGSLTCQEIASSRDSL